MKTDEPIIPSPVVQQKNQKKQYKRRKIDKVSVIASQDAGATSQNLGQSQKLRYRMVFSPNRASKKQVDDYRR